MALTLWKGKISKVVQNREVSAHRKDGWTDNKPSTDKPEPKPKRIRIKDSGSVKVKPRLSSSPGSLIITEETNNGD
jgi:hypothetical protein